MELKNKGFELILIEGNDSSFRTQMMVLYDGKPIGPLRDVTLHQTKEMMTELTVTTYLRTGHLHTISEDEYVAKFGQSSPGRDL